MKKNLIILFTIVTFGCSEKHDVSIFDGYWAIHRVCENGDIIKDDLGLVRIKSDTIFNFPLGDFDHGYCFMESTKDSLTLDRTCGEVRFKYEVNSELNRIHFKNTNQHYQFERIDSHDLNIERILNQTGIRIELPKSKSQNNDVGSNPRIIFIGKQITSKYPHCLDQKTLDKIELEELFEIADTCSPPFELPKDIIMKYSDLIVQPCQITELKNSFLDEIGALENVELIICADKNISQSTLSQLINEFFDPRIRIRQMKISAQNKMELRYD
jgi:hypothetical protein